MNETTLDQTIISQHDAERFLEDDVLYNILDFFHLNVYSILIILVTVFIAYKLGRLTGLKQKMFLDDLKSRYQDIEKRKKKLENKIQFYMTTIKWSSRSIWILLFIEVGLITNIALLKELNYSYFLRNSLTRNVIFSIVGVIFLVMFVRKWLIKRRNVKISNLRDFDKGIDELGRELLKNIGAEFMPIIKQELLAKRNYKAVECQTDEERKEDYRNNEDNKQLNISEYQTREIVMKIKEYYDKQQELANKNLQIHKDFIAEITTFVWCDYCAQLGAPSDDASPSLGRTPSEVLEDSKDNIEKTNAEETKAEAEDNKKTEVKSENNKESKDKTDEKNNEDKQEEPKKECTNHCLRHYFERAVRITEEFKRKSKEIFLPV